MSDRCWICGTTENLLVVESPDWAEEDESHWECDDCAAGLDVLGIGVGEPL